MLPAPLYSAFVHSTSSHPTKSKITHSLFHFHHFFPSLPSSYYHSLVIYPLSHSLPHTPILSLLFKPVPKSPWEAWTQQDCPRGQQGQGNSAGRPSSPRAPARPGPGAVVVCTLWLPLYPLELSVSLCVSLFLFVFVSFLSLLFGFALRWHEEAIGIAGSNEEKRKRRRKAIIRKGMNEEKGKLRKEEGKEIMYTWF